MTNNNPFLQEVLAHPEDDVPRLRRLCFGDALVNELENLQSAFGDRLGSYGW